MRLARLLLILSGLYFSNAQASPVMDMPGDVLLAQGAELRTRLNLNASQAGAWLQAESRTRSTLQERRARHERLQMDLEEALANNQNLAEIGRRIDASDSLTLDENRFLRQSWLHVFDTLDATQRHAVGDALHPQLQSSPAPSPRSSAATDDTPRKQGRGMKGNKGLGGGLGGGNPAF